ncbi:MAG: hypothetical protein GY719_31980 [bacterium]|nr:hypothetical protein [bacterium]
MSHGDQIENDALEDVLEEAKGLFRGGMSLSEIEIELSVVRKRSSFILDAVMPRLRHKAARMGRLGYMAWLKAILASPLQGGLLVILLVLVTIPFTFIAVVSGFGFFPPGRYPKMLLMAPGMLAGFLFFCIAASVIYLIKRASGNF